MTSAGWPVRRQLFVGLAAGAFCTTGVTACRAQEDDSVQGTQTLRRPDEFPPIASWLELRAAAATADSAQRRERYARVALPVARDRIPWVEAQARERFGDTTGAIRAYAALGARLTVLRLRAQSARSDADRTAARHALVALLDTAAERVGAREGVTLFDRLFTNPTAGEQLVMARAAADAGMWDRVRQGYAAVLAAHAPLTSRDQFRYGKALAALGRTSEALAAYAKVTAPAPLAAAAGFQRARVMLAAGRGNDARTVLRRVASRYPKDTSAAAALSLLADLATDDRNDAEARRLLLGVAKRFPSTRFGDAARYDAALLAYILGNYRAARTELASIDARGGGSLAAGYWLGRACEQLGDAAAARAAWRRVLARDSVSYYAALSARRLGTRNFNSTKAAADAPSVPSVAAVDSATERIEILRRLGMTPEVRYETDRLFRDAPASRERLLATAAAFSGTDQSGRSITLARRALSAYGASADVYRLVYPVVAHDTIVAVARAAGVDPVLVTALILQESSFNPRAISRTGARGLMQLMPSVAQTVASRLGVAPWSPDLLFHPGLNVRLGVAHLAPTLSRLGSVERALAAYNAGESRVARWVQKRGADDPEIFTERIPFAETRDYVKSIVRNDAMYRALYDWR